MRHATTTGGSSAALARLRLLVDAALMAFEGDATAAAEWLEAPHVSLGGLAPMEIPALGGVLTAHAIRLLPFPGEIV